MDIRDVNGVSRASAQVGAPVRSRDGSPASKPEALGNDDGFVGSGRLGQMRDLIRRAENSDAVRADAVARGRALLDSGELDRPEMAVKTAEAILSFVG